MYRQVGVFPHRDTPHQDQIRLVVVVRPRPVIVIQREVHRLDPLHVVGIPADRVGFAYGIRRVGGELLFQRGEEGGEDVDHEAVGGGEHLADVLVDDGVEDDRAYAVTLGRGVDLLDHHPGLVDAVDVRFAERHRNDIVGILTYFPGPGHKRPASPSGDSPAS
ncbi:V-type ATP synthase beta chain [Corchorus olitorius]|uniref:V-type ATP synthase beta chain n=1 Tax=Corchorus olitorius TaxID=93759 RepID=A0A1R3L0X9_9ROSI|nr:V-type ATP synthase beta chain [Corchorus olitorius]